MKRQLGWALFGAIAALVAGCGDDATGTGGGGGTGGGVSEAPCSPLSVPDQACEDIGPTGAVVTCDGSNGVDYCEVNGSMGEAEIDVEEIDADTCFSNDCEYTLKQKVYVTATVRVEPGTTFKGENNSALVVTTSGKIEAAGTSDEPIVFTSSRSEGSRAAGDWGGVALLGKATLSWGGEACGGDTGTVCTSNVEGLPADENRGLFGGEDDAHDCGYLNYTRIEFGGFELNPGNELNGLTVGGCGTDTNLSYVQIHRGLDDGVEFFGGTASIDHVIVTGTGDDCFDWDQGYRGAIQCFIGHHFNPSSGDPRGIEGDNFSQNNDVSPRSTPTVRYGTLIGDGSLTAEGVVNRRGSCGIQEGLVVYNFAKAGYDYRDGGWAAPMSWPSGTTVENSCFMMNDPNYPEDVGCGTDTEEDCNDDDGAGNFFAEDEQLSDPARGNSETDPMLGDVSGAVDGTATPDYSVGNGACIGGFGPGDTSGGGGAGGAGGAEPTDWTEGWTAYPED